MIVLDTDVISELMRLDRADERVVAWLGDLSEQPVTTVINRAEVLVGVATLPAGRRRDGLWRAADQAFSGLGVVLPLTDPCANRYAAVVAARREQGRPISIMDALIASICVETEAQLATRDVADFDGLGLTLVDPWAWAGPVR